MTLVQALHIALSALSAVAAGAAAWLWFLSARVETPTSFSVHVVRPQFPPLSGDPMGGKYVGHAYSSDFTKLSECLGRQSRLSARAALCAGASAILQSA